MVGVVRGHQRAHTLKPYSQKTNQLDHRTTVMSNSMKLSHAMWGHPRQSGHGGEVWQNVVHWRREWQTLQYSCLENPMNSMRRHNDRILKEELPRSVGAQYATGDQWRNNSRKNERMEPKQKQCPVVDVTGDRSKVWCCKENYCIGTWNVRSNGHEFMSILGLVMDRGAWCAAVRGGFAKSQTWLSDWTELNGIDIKLRKIYLIH